VIVLYAYWTDAALDGLLNNWANSTVQRIEKRAKNMGIFHPFKFLNDANATQRPLDEYGGGKSLARLRDISAKYDTDRVFQTMVGGFKLWA